MNIHRTHRGFTLTEIMISMTIMGVVAAAVMTFYVQTARGIHASERRMVLASDVTRFTNELILHASRANQFVLFKSSAAADRDGPNTAPNAGGTDRQTIPGAGPGLGLHPAGDFVVFVYYEIPKPIAETFHRITRLEGYYLAGESNGIGPLRKITVALETTPYASTAANIATAVEDILTANWNNTSVTSFKTCLPLARGLAVPEVVDGTPPTGTPTPRVFYMSDDRNVIVSGQIFGGSQDKMTNDSRTYSTSFYFTITPRT